MDKSFINNGHCGGQVYHDYLFVQANGNIVCDGKQESFYCPSQNTGKEERVRLGDKKLHADMSVHV